MPKAERYRAFLVTVLVRHQPRRTYAVLTRTPEDALAAVKQLSTEKSKLYVVGGLSRILVRHLKMKPNDMRLIDSGSQVPPSAPGAASLPPSLLATPGGDRK
ncbi:hypothetical protein U8607_15250 [Methylobacterium durans]|uniref:hypothetical protein n=1 Tax=Methylobacterium durans TaxID=2202825 RepID=UPI002AFE82CE|nr:hypothetical protein [Methylobacterium durans]MEA1833440.1 hypothetical protein [Methylobacterium durans]